MLLTVLIGIFFIVFYRLNKKEKNTKYFLQLFTFLLGSSILAIIPVNFLIGFCVEILTIVIAVIVLNLCKRKVSLLSQKKVNILLYVILLISIYTQFFNGIETFYYDPVKYFRYSTDITYRYFYVPPKIFSNKAEGQDYIYSLTQCKNSFLLPESVTKIDLYNGRACYYLITNRRFGESASVNLRYFYNDDYAIFPV